jgi:hypothetical protein
MRKKRAKWFAPIIDELFGKGAGQDAVRKFTA